MSIGLTIGLARIRPRAGVRVPLVPEIVARRHVTVGALPIAERGPGPGPDLDGAAFGKAGAGARRAVRERRMYCGVSVRRRRMNVPLAEAGVRYEPLEINAEFDTAGAALVTGANGVIRPIARSDPSNRTCGMPNRNADKAQNVVLVKRGQGKGLSGICKTVLCLDDTRMRDSDGQQIAIDLRPLRQGAPGPAPDNQRPGRPPRRSRTWSRCSGVICRKRSRNCSRC